MLEKIEKLIDDLVDATDPKTFDKVCIIILGVSTMISLYLFSSSLMIVKNTMLNIHSKWIYNINIIIIAIMFFLSFLGEKLSKPVNRPKVFLWITLLLSVNTYSLLSEKLNYAFTSIIDFILATGDLPFFLISTNTKIVTVFIPVAIVLFTFYRPIEIFFNQSEKDMMREYRLNVFVKNFNKPNPMNVDIIIGEDVKTGKNIIVSEKTTFEHKLISGASGSGKTALNIRPDLSQILYKKALYREMLKKRTFEALENGLIYFNAPYTNKYINSNFSMDLIEIEEGKREEFIGFFKDLIIGVRKSLTLINSIKATSYNEVYTELPFKVVKNTELYYYEITVYERNKEVEKIKIESDLISTLDTSSELFDINIEHKLYTVKEITENKEAVERYIEKKINDFKGEEKLFSQFAKIKITNKRKKKLEYKVSLYSKTKGKIIYKNVGLMVIAPDGGLAKDTFEIAAENEIPVIRLDPKQEEIDNGLISSMNPMLVGSPQKAGDVISSILVAMDQNAGKDTNPYFTNSNIRAVRNLVILLRLTYPIKHNGENPILEDMLSILNNMNSVKEYVRILEKEPTLAIKWKGVIDYFKTSFYNPETDNAGNVNKKSNIGVNQNKTREAISGLITQLDNFIGREEIRYILSNRNEGLNLDKALEEGSCICVATRQAELGSVLGKAFGLMMILSIQNAILSRYSEDEQPEIPFEIYIDEFPMYINDETKTFFTFSRKYKAATNVAVQSLGQLEEVSVQFRQTILTNCRTVVVLPGSNVEDREYFSKYFGVSEKLELSTSITSNPAMSENPKYSEATRGQLTEKNNVSEQELGELEFRRGFYATVDKKGRRVVGKAFLDFVKLTDNNTQKIEYIDFSKFIKDDEEKEELYGDINDNNYNVEKNEDKIRLDIDKASKKDIENAIMKKVNATDYEKREIKEVDIEHKKKANVMNISAKTNITDLIDSKNMFKVKKEEDKKIKEDKQVNTSSIKASNYLNIESATEPIVRDSGEVFKSIDKEDKAIQEVDNSLLVECIKISSKEEIDTYKQTKEDNNTSSDNNLNELVKNDNSFEKKEGESEKNIIISKVEKNSTTSSNILNENKEYKSKNNRKLRFDKEE